MSSAEIPLPDPYAERPSFLKQHREAVTVAVVFGLTVSLAVLSFPPFHFPSLAYAMLVPGIFWAYLQPRLKVYAWTMFAAQAVAWTIILAWLHHVTWFGLFLLGPLVGIWIGVWYLAAWWVMPRMIGRPVIARLIAMLGLAATWSMIEWTRTWLLSGFPWLPLAASQWERASILQIAAYTGASGVSFVLVAVNIGFAAYAHRLFREGDKTGLRKRSQEFFLAVFLLLVCLNVHVQETFNRHRFSVPLGRVALVQPYIPQVVKWDPEKANGILEILEKTTLVAAASKPDLILWPEASTPWALRGDANMKAFVESLSVRAKAPMLVGSIAIEGSGQADERWFNGAFLVDPKTGIHPDYYAKRHLVPFGEYVPLRPVLGWLSKFVPIGGDFQRGDKASPLLVTLQGTPVVIGPLICYEDIYPRLARSSSLAGAEVLCVVTNNAWYGEGGAAYQHAAHSVLRAVETRRPVLRCGNGGWSGWIDEFGAVRKVVLDKNGGIYFRGAETLGITRDSRWIGRSSFYVQHGDWFVGLCVVLAGFAFVNTKLISRTGTA
jgi:apolipoprotein N-acyltransferase